jgi:DNA topoisomerase-1
MGKKLVIVESPAKAKTIEKFLGSDFEVRASMGHIMDLPPKGLGVNIRKDFEPKYQVIERKDALIKELKSASKKAEEIYLAPDPDREGEFIAWALKKALDLRSPRRAVFHEITRRAVTDAIAHPREIDERLFNAQQARRVLDRLVGYKISPLLWRRVQSGTSAGRVQSVALRLICEREAEIRAFQPEEYWTIDALLSKAKQRKTFTAALFARLGSDELANPAPVPASPQGKGEPAPASEVEADGRLPGERNGVGTDREERTKIQIRSEEEAQAILQHLEGAAYRVTAIERRDVRRQPYLPYTTSTLQQDASVRLRFKPKRTMSLAQELYEGVNLGNQGHQGLITYMRTDSTRISAEAQAAVKAYIGATYGKDYVGEGRTGKAKAGVQDAHEAIRPTDVQLTPDVVRPFLGHDQYRLYTLIWQRFVAAFMTPAVFDTIRVDIRAGRALDEQDGEQSAYLLRANGSTLKFRGFYAVWPRDDREDTLPPLTVGELLDLHELQPAQHFTQPPPRYTEASLIKELEERGIGRPSTYVPIVSTVQDRGYVEQQERRFVPTWLGETINEIMTKHFPDIVDVGFTAGMEQKLDDIEEGKQIWTNFLHSFYDEFKVTLDRAETEMSRVQKPVEELGEACPECGRPLVIRMGRFGRFISCSGFPVCRYRRSFVARTGALCPVCGNELVERKTRKQGRMFYGCANYPTCNFATWDRPVPERCPRCGGLMVIPQGRAGDARNGGGSTQPEPQCWICDLHRDIEPEPAVAARPASRRRATGKSAIEDAEPAVASASRTGPARRATRSKAPATTSRSASRNGTGGQDHETRSPGRKRQTSPARDRSLSEKATRG